MTTNYKIRLLKHPDVTDLDGEKVMIDYERGKYFLLSGSANDIWDLLREGIESENIVSELVEKYDIEIAECRKSVMKFLSELENIGFITLEVCN